MIKLIIEDSYLSRFKKIKKFYGKRFYLKFEKQFEKQILKADFKVVQKMINLK